MTRWRIYATANPYLSSAPVQPMDPKEQAVLDEIRRRRAERCDRSHKP